MKDINIGFIGLGNVGSKIAMNILKGWYNLFIYDLDKKKGEKLIKAGSIWCDNFNNLDDPMYVVGVYSILSTNKSKLSPISIISFGLKNLIWS